MKRKNTDVCRKKSCNKSNYGKLQLREFSNVKGITLIALVVTIIILLILAGVAINLSVGDNGLFHKAQEAVNTYKVAEQKEDRDLRILENELEKAKVDWSKVYDSTGYTAENKPIKTIEGTYYIPEGFKLADDSAGKISDGIVVEDKNGNQWVWVPCWSPNGKNVSVENRPNEDKELSEEEYANKKRLVKFDRYAFSREDWSCRQTKLDEKDEDGSYKILNEGLEEGYYHEALPTEQNESVKTYGGFYIGRYEAGDAISTEAKEMRKSGDAQDNAVSIKKNQAPYNFVSLENREILSAGMAEANGYNTEKVFTVLCNSYAWDTTLMFIGGDYAINSAEYGNYPDTTFSYTDIVGNKQTKNKNTNKLVPTGQLPGVKNIHDMAGNLWEYTTENIAKPDFIGVDRGGYFFVSSYRDPAGFRGGFQDTFVEDESSGFRPTMFLK